MNQWPPHAHTTPHPIHVSLSNSSPFFFINTHTHTNTHIHTLKYVKAWAQICTYINTPTCDIAIPNFHKVYRGTGEAGLIDGLMNLSFLVLST